MGFLDLHNVLISLACAIVGAFLSFIITLKVLKNKLKKTPVITEKQLRILFSSMGVNPGEKRIKSILNKMNEKK